MLPSWNEVGVCWTSGESGGEAGEEAEDGGGRRGDEPCQEVSAVSASTGRATSDLAWDWTDLLPGPVPGWAGAPQRGPAGPDRQPRQQRGECRGQDLGPYDPDHPRHSQAHHRVHQEAAQLPVPVLEGPVGRVEVVLHWVHDDQDCQEVRPCHREHCLLQQWHLW